MKLLKLNFFTKKKIAAFFNSPLLNNLFVDICHYVYAKRKIKKLQNSLPQNFILETTNFCNAKCIMCGYKDMKRRKGFMDIETFRSIVDDAKNCGIKWITLQGYGEPLLDKGIFEKIKFIKDKGIKVTFNTNGSLLNETKTKLLIQAGLDEIFISLDAFSKEKYEKIRFPLDFGTVTRNTEKLLEIKKAMSSEVPRVTLTFAVQDETEAEVNDFYNYWKDKCDSLIIAYVKNWAGQVNVNSKNSPHITNLHRRNYNPCEYLWTSLYVQYDGKVALCCDDYEGSVILGDLGKESILDIWHGAKLQAYRKAHLTKKRTLMPLCGGCYRHINWFNVQG